MQSLACLSPVFAVHNSTPTLAVHHIRFKTLYLAATATGCVSYYRKRGRDRSRERERVRERSRERERGKEREKESGRRERERDRKRDGE